MTSKNTNRNTPLFPTDSVLQAVAVMTIGAKKAYEPKEEASAGYELPAKGLEGESGI
jgi:hypothetical protein